MIKTIRKRSKYEGGGLFYEPYPVIPLGRGCSMAVEAIECRPEKISDLVLRGTFTMQDYEGRIVLQWKDAQVALLLKGDTLDVDEQLSGDTLLDYILCAPWDQWKLIPTQGRQIPKDCLSIVGGKHPSRSSF